MSGSRKEDIMRNHIKLADIYCRLSDEEKKHKNESESITNQRAIIRDYCEKHDITGTILRLSVSCEIASIWDTPYLGKPVRSM